MQEELPTKTRIALTDLGVTLILSIPFIISPILSIIAIIDLWPFYNHDNKEIMNVILALAIPFSLTLIAGMWWINETQKAFKYGEQLVGNIIYHNGAVGPYFGVIYKFKYLGNEITDRAALINNKRTKKLDKSKPVVVLYNPRKRRSFLKEAYIDI